MSVLTGVAAMKRHCPQVTLAGVLSPLNNLIIKGLGNSYKNIIPGGSGHEMPGSMLGLGIIGAFMGFPMEPVVFQPCLPDF